MTSKSCDVYTLPPKANTAVADVDLAGSFTDRSKPKLYIPFTEPLK